MTRLICFDCDSTLSAIEGIDELARFRGAGIFEKVEAMTRAAMDGGTPLEEIFARRLDLIRPTAEEVRRVGKMYIEQIEPDAGDVIAELKKNNWLPVIVSGGFRQAILPLAEFLGIKRVEAVDIFFNDDGSYRDFGKNCPPARARGKNLAIMSLKNEYKADEVVMVGDGASDLETLPDVNLFVGFGRYAVREKVKTGAHKFIMRLADLPAAL